MIAYDRVLDVDDPSACTHPVDETDSPLPPSQPACNSFSRFYLLSCALVKGMRIGMAVGYLDWAKMCAHIGVSLVHIAIAYYVLVRLPEIQAFFEASLVRRPQIKVVFWVWASYYIVCGLGLRGLTEIIRDNMSKAEILRHLSRLGWSRDACR
jgi:hypothetical protein